MRFRVIEGGLAASARDMMDTSALSLKDVQAEADRRLRLAGYERYQIRQKLTGEPVPRALQYLKLQIGWVAETLASIDPIPPDFTDDKYWPTVDPSYS
jgi:hypothetical protein